MLIRGNVTVHDVTNGYSEMYNSLQESTNPKMKDFVKGIYDVLSKICKEMNTGSLSLFIFEYDATLLEEACTKTTTNTDTIITMYTFGRAIVLADVITALENEKCNLKDNRKT